MYAARLGPILDDYLRDLGFTTLSEVRRRNDPVPAVHALTARDIARSLREDERGYQQLKKLAKEVPRELDDGTRDMVTNGLDGMPATDTHVVDPESLQTWLAKLESDSDRGTRWALRREIQLALRLRRKTHPGKRAPAVPPPCSPPPEMAAIRAVHLEALRCASSLAQWAHDEFRALTDTAQPVCARQALAGLVLLAQWGMGSRLDQLLAITDASNQLHGAPEWGNAALVEIPIQLGEISEADAPGQMIAAPRQALPVIAYLRRAQAADLVSADTLTAALRDNAQLVRLIGNSEDPLHDMLRIIGASRRLLAGGPRAAWESGELASVGPRLSALVASGSSQVSSVDAPATLAFEQPMLGDEHTSQRWTDFARLRKALNGYAEKPYHRQHRDEVDQLAQAANKAGGDGEIVNVIATLVQRYLHHGRPKWAASTLHNRISLLSSVVSRHAGIDYGREDTDAIVDDLRRLVISYQAGDSQRARKGRNAVIQAIRWLCDGYSRFCEIELSVGDIIGEVMDEGPRSPGYWVSEDDSIATIERLREWGEVTATTVASAGDTQEWLRTELAVRLHALLQLRSGEAAGLFARDLVLTEDRICAFVRPRPKRSLKTASSKRWVSTNIAPATSARISVLIESLQESRVPGELGRVPSRGVAPWV